MIVDSNAICEPSDRILIFPPEKDEEKLMSIRFSIFGTYTAPDTGEVFRRQPSWKMDFEFIRKVPGAEPDGADFYKCPISDGLFEVLEALNVDQILFTGGIAGDALKKRLNELLLKYRFSRGLDEDKLKFQLAIENEYTEETGTAALPAEAHAIIGNPDPAKHLASYQRFAIFCAMRTGCHGFWFDPGVGKTYTAIALAANLAYHRNRPDPDSEFLMQGFPDIKPLDPAKPHEPITVLVVPPASLRSNWKKEVSRMSWDWGEGRPVFEELKGSLIEREMRLQILKMMAVANKSPYLVIMTTYDNFVSDAFLKTYQWHLIVADETQAIKDPRTNRSRALVEYGPLISQGRISLTGTPVGNSVVDLYPQLEFMRRGASGVGGLKQFREAYGAKIETNGLETFSGASTPTELKKLIARTCCVVKKNHVLRSLPPLSWEIIDCDMSSKQEKAYRGMRDGMVAQIEEGVQKGTLEATHILTMMLRLAQITAGYLPLPDSVDVHTEEITNSEIVYFDQKDNLLSRDAMALQLMEELPHKEKAIVWVPFLPALTYVRDLLKEYNPVIYYGTGMTADQKTAAVNTFNNDPKCRLFIGTPASGGAGLNLLGYEPGNVESDTNATLMIYWSYTWSYLQREQSAARPYRKGTRLPVRAVDLQVPGTIDQIILERLEAKKELATDMQSVLAVLKAIQSIVR